jgi:hypothetical protein
MPDRNTFALLRIAGFDPERTFVARGNRDLNAQEVAVMSPATSSVTSAAFARVISCAQ